MWWGPRQRAARGWSSSCCSAGTACGMTSQFQIHNNADQHMRGAYSAIACVVETLHSAVLREGASQSDAHAIA
jgi:hypothetical protein